MNNKIYTHEFIDVIGHNRANYMHHMTANWSPIAQEERNQLCYGVWGVVGTTGRWPEVVNMWEEDGFDGLAEGFRLELSRPTLQDEKLEKWWAEAANFRRGGIDRLLIPAEWTRTVSELCADGVSGTAYAHETYRVRPGTAGDFLSLVRDEAIDAYGRHGWELVGALRTALHDDAECIVIWAIPTWEQWAAFESDVHYAGGLKAWRERTYEWTTGFERFLMMDAPLSPMKIGRQPARDDRTGWTD